MNSNNEFDIFKHFRLNFRMFECIRNQKLRFSIGKFSLIEYFAPTMESEFLKRIQKSKQEQLCIDFFRFTSKLD